jgi:tetrapyrrole methylase family protein / MazG family protein
VARLRGPGGCPWDQEQTHESIRAQLLEECYEALEAIDQKDDVLLREELGDVLLHVVFHAQLAEERGVFTLDEVAQGIREKLVRRHPHVFGDDKLKTSDEVLKRWDELKKLEKPERKGALDGVPALLPALMRAQEIQKKAAKVGFDWQELMPVLQKVREELDELEEEVEREVERQMERKRELKAPGSQPDSSTKPRVTEKRVAEELGDLLFSVVNLARHLKIDAEQACRDATRKFSHRFEKVEALAKASGRQLVEMTLTELDLLWEQAKRQSCQNSQNPEG